MCTEAELTDCAKTTENRLGGREQQTWGYVEVGGWEWGPFYAGGWGEDEGVQAKCCMFLKGWGDRVEVGHSSHSYGFHKPFTLR